ncbi:hypothetical protein ACWD4T_49950, partial [Streptomyces umbrinus]
MDGGRDGSTDSDTGGGTDGRGPTRGAGGTDGHGHVRGADGSLAEVSTPGRVAGPDEDISQEELGLA